MWMGYIPLTISRKMKTSWIKHTKKCFRKNFEGHSNRKWFNVDIIYCVTETCKVYFFSCGSLGVQEVRGYNYANIRKILCFSIYALSWEFWTFKLLLPIFKLSVTLRSHQFTSNPLKFSCPTYSSMHRPLRLPSFACNGPFITCDPRQPMHASSCQNSSP